MIIDLLDAAEYAKLGYNDFKKNQGIRIVSGNDSVLIIRKPKYTLISFEGSNSSLSDWISNFNFPKIEDELGEFHEGFASSAKNLVHEILDFLHGSSEKPLVLCGHSRGGALALYAAKELNSYLYNVDSVYSFGAPRGGNSEWVKSFNYIEIPHYRVVNGGDRVPKLPRVWWGFRHDCKEIYIKGRWWTKIWLLGYASHSIDRYIKNLK